jgi:hypothetical protein
MAYTLPFFGQLTWHWADKAFNLQSYGIKSFTLLCYNTEHITIYIPKKLRLHIGLQFLG